MSIFYINGDYVDESQATLSARDLAVLRGYGAFDFLRTYGGHPFRLEKNLARLRHSCELIELNFPWSDAELEAIVLETIQRNADASDEFSIRIVVTGGLSSNNITPDGDSALMVMVQPLKPLPAAYYSDGVKVITTHTARVIPGAKSTIYTPAILAQKRAKAAGAIEAIYLDDDDNVLEGTTSNIFALYGNTLVTPDPHDEQILPGITRMTILEMAQDHYDVVIRDLPYEELLQADEVFITAANKQILPVVTVDEHTIGDGKVGEGTQHLMALFQKLTERRATGEMI